MESKGIRIMDLSCGLGVGMDFHDGVNRDDELAILGFSCSK